MKKIIIACDSYKGCLKSKEVNEVMALGVKKQSLATEGNVNSNAPETITLEMSDGGEGMLDAFLSAMGGYFFILCGILRKIFCQKFCGFKNNVYLCGIDG